jgi:CheY-like chemotaxis protein
MDPLLRRVLAENVHVQVVRSAGLWLAEVDPGQLEVALLNLSINARDAMPDGGRITIEATNVSRTAAAEIGSDGLAAGEYVCVAVGDTGVGMSPDVLERAFEPFFTTKDVGKGTGLGLSMVYGFVKQSGGHAAIESQPGRGTTVKLYFPRVVRSADERASAGAQSEARGGREHVLVVEDEALVRDHVVGVLRELGYRVTAAANGTQALAVLATNADVDLLFTDVVMPGGLNGRQLADAARELRPGLSVLFTSGYAEDVLGGRTERGVQLIGKPYRHDELAAKLRAVLDAAGAA